MPDKELLEELLEHYHIASQDNETRKTRKNGWDSVLKSYFGWKPDNWPYLSHVIDPLIRTTIIEKTARQFNSRLKGRVVSRKGGDYLSSKLQNALLDFQWDNAELDGTMLEKWALMGVQTRLFGASFGLAYWRTEVENGKPVFEGNDFKVLDNRDVLVDYTANHVKNANWVQVREFLTIDDMRERNKMHPEPLYDNLDELEKLVGKGDSRGDPRDVLYTSVVKEQLSLEDRVGRDRTFPVVEIVTEYRKDRWVVFAPRYNLILGDIDNPYNHKKIPVVQLRYYPNGDDVYGDSEVESVLSIQRAINVFLSGYIDQMNLAMRPPVKIANNSTVQLDTIVYGPNALWLTGSSVNNVVEQQFSPSITNNFQSVYQALRAAFNTAMGEFSMGVSNMKPFEGGDKTATEVRAMQSQSLSRDQYNQMYLTEAIKDQMQFWISNNQQYIFDDPKKIFYLFRIVGRDMIKDLMETGAGDTVVDNQILTELAGMVEENGGKLDGATLETLADEARIPKYPVIINPKAKEEKQVIKPKLSVDDSKEYADVYLLPEDVEGSYEYIPDVQSMALGAREEQRQGKQEALTMILNPQIDQRLQTEGYRVNIKELLIQVLETNGVKDADKYFEELKEVQNAGLEQGTQKLGGSLGSPGQPRLEAPQGVDATATQPVLPGPGGGGGLGNIPAPVQQGVGNV